MRISVRTPGFIRLNRVGITIGVAIVFGLLVTALPTAPRAHADGGGVPITVTVPWSGTLTGTDANGDPLTDDPTLSPGQSVHLVLTGFSPGESVTVILHSAPRTLNAATAGADGTVDYAFTVPADLESGAHTLVFTGTQSAAVATFAFTVAGGVQPTSPPPTQPADNGGQGDEGDSVTSTSTGGLASTGVDALAQGDLAAALIAVGAGLLLCARVRRDR